MNKLVLGFMMTILLLGCGNLTTVGDETWITLTEKEGYHPFKVEYASRINRVKLENIPIESKKQYYVEEGKYNLTYKYNAMFNFDFEISYNENDNGRNNSDDHRDYFDLEEELLVIDKETEIFIDEKNVKFNISGGVGF